LGNVEKMQRIFRRISTASSAPARMWVRLTAAWSPMSFAVMIMEIRFADDADIVRAAFYLKADIDRTVTDDRQSSDRI
jgi:hypothetical protein